MTVTAAVIVATTRVYDMPGLLALAPWTDDKTLIEWQLAQVLAAGVRDVEVVIPPDGDAIIPLVARDNVEIVIDSRNDGIATGIQAGVTALPRGTTDALIVDVAQPVDAVKLRDLMDTYESDQWLGLGGRRRTPFVAGQRATASLRNAVDDDGVRRALSGALVQWCAVDDEIRSRETYDRYRREMM